MPRIELIVDTCSMVEFEPFVTFATSVREWLVSGAALLRIPNKCIDEMNAIIHNERKPHKSRLSAYRALVLLYSLSKLGCVEFFGETDKLADAVILAEGLALRSAGKSVFVLTNDRALASDLLSLNALTNVARGRGQVKVYRLGKNGELAEFTSGIR